MSHEQDVRATKMLRAEFGRKLIDVTQADIRIVHGVAYVRGVAKTLSGGPPDTKSAMITVCDGLRQKGTIKDFIIDCAFRT